MRRFDHWVFKSDSASYLNPNTGHHKTIFRTKEQKFKTGSDPYLVLVSPARFDALLRAMLTLFAAIPLLVPVLILFELQPSADHIRVYSDRLRFLLNLHQGKKAGGFYSHCCVL